MSEQIFVAILRFRQLAEPVTILWNHKEVGQGHGRDISERHAQAVFVDYVGWDFFADKLVKNGIFLWLS